MTRNMIAVLLVLLCGTLLASCTVSTSLVPTLSEEDGRFGTGQRVRQPFYSESDGLHKLTVRFYPEGFPGSQIPVDPSEGATVSVNYAPDDDPRFPEPSFHEWPEDHEWLPELTGGSRYEQTFCSPYPDLSGIEVRVATFGADISAGTGVLEPFETVEVLSLPVVGEHVGFLPGGSEIEVVNTSEGWVRVVLGDNERGWIDMEHFESLPDPQRVNNRDVILELYEGGSDDPVRESIINAAEMHDNSHVLFEFPVVDEALGSCYRFSVASPESEPGNAITLRYDPDDQYPDGEAIINGEQRDGEIVFQPRYDLREPLYQGNLDDYEWAAPLDAFEARFDPVPETGDRYLEVAIDPGNSSVNLPWSRNRPPGQQPLQVDGMPDAPQGGLVFNAAFRADIPVQRVGWVWARDLYSRARLDPTFFAVIGALLIGTVAIGTYAYWRSDPDGR